jgi:hypothetical protein
MRSFFTTVLLATGLCLGASSLASAEAPSVPSHVTELPLTVIHGEPQRPMASYILTRSGDRYEVRELRASFVREVVRSVEGESF